MTQNQKAFLDMIAKAEGTYGLGDHGYNVLFGGALFAGYKDHPRIYNRAGRTTAAGRYQLLARYFDYYKKTLHLQDFSPRSQDLIALQQIRECRALIDIEKGNLPKAIDKCARIWASFPGAGYGQPEQTEEFMQRAFISAGGEIAAG